MPLRQADFVRDLTRLLTPLPCRARNSSSTQEAGASQPDVASWYNTPGVTAAAASSSSSSSSSAAAAAAGDSYQACHAEWGARQVPGGPPPDADTLFQACSISKAFQSLAVLHYISEGTISSLDDPVARYLSEATRRTLLGASTRRGLPGELAAQLLDRMTIAQLLSHTAGTSAAGFQGYPEPSSRVPSAAEVLQGGPGGANSPAVVPHALPGVQFEYSGGGSTVLQAMLENLGAQEGLGSFAELMAAKVLRPLGMTRSFYCGGARLPQAERNYATGYHNGSHPLEAGGYHVYPEQGAAGLWTTSVDLVRGLTGFAHALLGTTPPVVRAGGRAWIRPEVARTVLQRRPELGHGGASYYCGFHVAFLGGGEGDLARDAGLVRISHSGGNHGYRCWAAAVLPLPGARGVDAAAVRALAVMTNSNCGGEIVGPLVMAIGEMLDSPLGPPGDPGAPYAEATPLVALEESGTAAAAAAAGAGLGAYEGEWAIQDRTQTLRITAGAGPVVTFSHLQGVELPLRAVAARGEPEFVRLRASALDVVLELGRARGGGEAALTLCTGGSRIKCSRLGAA